MSCPRAVQQIRHSAAITQFRDCRKSMDSFYFLQQLLGLVLSHFRASQGCPVDQSAAESRTCHSR